MKRSALIGATLAALAAQSPVAALDGSEHRAAGAGYGLSGDSERFIARRASVEGIIGYQHLDSKIAVRYSDHAYSQNGWRSQAEQLRFVASRIDRQTIDGWRIEAGLLRHAAQDLWTVDASYRKSLSAGPAVEFFLNRDIVETRAALGEGTYFEFGGASVDMPLSPHITVVGLAGYQAFSDDNRRRHLRARAIWQPSLDLGLTLQLRYRWYDNSQTDVGSAYFNPARYQEGLLAVGWRQRLGDWRTALTAGVGRQQIASATSTMTQLLETSAEKQVGAYAVRLRAGYSRSAAAVATDDPDYWYRYAVGEVVIPF
jgi:hypothetical protein